MTTKKTKKIVKPKKHIEEYWDFNEVQEYLEQLHGKDFRDFAGHFGKKGKDSAPYQDFWHWICDLNEVHNGSYIYLPEWDYYMNNEETEPWKKEIMQYFKDFLGEDYNRKIWISW